MSVFTLVHECLQSILIIKKKVEKVKEKESMKLRKKVPQQNKKREKKRSMRFYRPLQIIKSNSKSTFFWCLFI